MMMNKFYIFLFIFIYFLIIISSSQSAHLSSKKLQLLSEYALILKNLKKYTEAERIYQKLLKQNETSIDVYFEYISLLMLMQKNQDAEKNINNILFRFNKNINAAQRHRLQLLQAEVLKEKGEHKKALSVLPKNMANDNLLYIAPIYLWANEYDEYIRLLNVIKSSPEYSQKEKEEADNMLLEVKNLRENQLTSNIRFIYNESTGSLMPVHTVLGSTLSNFGNFKFHLYTLNRRQNMEFETVRTEGLINKASLNLIMTDQNNFGIKGEWKQNWNADNMRIKLFYNELETDVTALLSEFSRKHGAEIETSITLAPKWNAGIVSGSGRYFIADGEFVGEMHSIHPYISHAEGSFFRQQIGWLAIRGEGNEDYVAHQFDMWYGSLNGNYAFGEGLNKLEYNFIVGYMSGENSSGLTITPKFGFQCNLFPHATITSTFEYRTDTTTGRGESRTELNLKLIF